MKRVTFENMPKLTIYRLREDSEDILAVNGEWIVDSRRVQIDGRESVGYLFATKYNLRIL